MVFQLDEYHSTVENVDWYCILMFKYTFPDTCTIPEGSYKISLQQKGLQYLWNILLVKLHIIVYIIITMNIIKCIT